MIATALLMAGLSGCYVPLDFYAEVEIDRSGYYKMAFDGYLAWAPLYQKLRKGTLTPSEEKKEVAIIETDLKRDPAVGEVRYMGRGRFKVDWRTSGDLMKTKMVSFVRRNENMLSLKFLKKEKEMVLSGTSVSRTRAKQLTDIGLNITGELKVRTDARVVSHNATSVVKNGVRERIYIWKIRSAFDPAPNLVIAVR